MTKMTESGSTKTTDLETSSNDEPMDAELMGSPIGTPYTFTGLTAAAASALVSKSVG
jgi:hypothetical protein